MTDAFKKTLVHVLVQVLCFGIPVAAAYLSHLPETGYTVLVGAILSAVEKFLREQGYVPWASAI